MDREIYDNMINFFGDEFYLDYVEGTLNNIAQSIIRKEEMYNESNGKLIFHCFEFVSEKRKENLDYFLGKFQEIKENIANQSVLNKIKELCQECQKIKKKYELMRISLEEPDEYRKFLHCDKHIFSYRINMINQLQILVNDLTDIHITLSDLCDYAEDKFF